MRSFIAGTVLSAVFLVSGCAHNQDQTARTTRATGNDVFAELASPEAGPGKTVTEIKFTVKSNSSRFMETYKKHSDPPYRFHLNIDGQTAILEVEPVLEDKSPADPTLPESGIGWIYHFSKWITLAPGKHALTLALPVDDVNVEREVELHAGANTITVTPIYNTRSFRPFKGENFTAGVKSVVVVVD